MTTASYWLEYAWLPTGLTRGVRVNVWQGRFREITTGQPRGSADVEFDGLALPGLANAHSHAFHRALRGRTHAGERGGTFWTWRERMYAIAALLEPDSYQQLATAVFAEMAAAGISCVGEFHYLHHRPDGSPYPDPNAMGWALIRAARDAGVRITLLDTCYLAGGLTADGHQPLAGPQIRFGDGDVAGWRRRISPLTGADGNLGGHARLGAAIHSVRAIPAPLLSEVTQTATDFELPLHVHLSEQPAENEAALAHYGRTPTQLLDEAGALGTAVTAVHATHLSEDDIARLGSTGTNVCACPCTEADLADGVGPFPALQKAGAPLCLGTDQHVEVDILTEARRLELDQRLISGQRGRFTPDDLITAATAAGHESLGWFDAGTIAPGYRADLAIVDLTSPRTAGSDPHQIVMTAAASDVTDVIVDGVAIVTDRQHRLGDVGTLLADSISSLWQAADESEERP